MIQNKQLKQFSQIVLLISKGIANRKLYYSDHPRVNSYASDIVDLVNDYFAMTGVNELFIGIYDGSFVFEGKRVFGPSVAGKPLLQLATALHSGGISLHRGITISELRRFFDISALRSVPSRKLAESRALLTKYGVSQITLGDTYKGDSIQQSPGTKKIWEGETVASSLGSPTALFQELFDVVSMAHGDASFNRNLDMDRARSVSEFMLKYIQSNFADVMQYVHYPDYDSYTVGHSVRVASLTVYVGSRMGWDDKDLLAIGTAGLLHDIGKCKIPDEILMKKGKLTEEEYELVKHHPKDGTEILLEQKNVSNYTLAASWGHHHRFDRGGYPKQPKWAVRHPVTALLQICDVFEALTAVRPYKEAMQPIEAYSIMLSDKGGFHPALLAAFIQIVGLYPPGTYVQLEDGRVGMVIDETAKIDRPKLIITTTKYGQALYDNDQYMLDLSDENQQSVGVKKLLLGYHDFG